MTDWDRIWRGSGIGAVLFLVVAGVLYGSSPKVGASAEKLVSFWVAVVSGFLVMRRPSAARAERAAVPTA